MGELQQDIRVGGASHHQAGDSGSAARSDERGLAMRASPQHGGEGERTRVRQVDGTSSREEEIQQADSSVEKSHRAKYDRVRWNGDADQRARVLTRFQSILNLIVEKNPQATNMEIAQQVGRNTVYSRLLEMEKMGFIRRTGKRQCRLSGRLSSMWEVVDVR